MTCGHSEEKFILDSELKARTYVTYLIQQKAKQGKRPLSVRPIDTVSHLIFQSEPSED